MKRWLGLKKLVHDAVDRTTDLVQDAHELGARKTLMFFEPFGPIGETAHAVDGVRKLITDVTFASIRGVNRAVDVTTDLGINALGQLDSGEDPNVVNKGEGTSPMKSTAVGGAQWLGDAALGVVNGIVGDHLHATENGLDLGFRFRLGEHVVEPAGDELQEALANHNGKLVLFVHGLCTTEWSWCMNAEEYYGDPAVSFGSQLEEELGFLPLYARYNTGRHIAESGRALANGLQSIIEAAEAQKELRQLILVGHSMGGLTIRSACHFAHEEGMSWLAPLSHLFYLGSPHRGAPLEKFGNALSSLLRVFDVPGTVVPASVIDIRSAGIRDLRFGTITDDDDDAELLEGVTHAFISATVTEGENPLLREVIGDVLVGATSASGPELERDTFKIETHHFGAMHHLELQNHPDVYAQIRRIITEESPAPQER